MGKLGIDDATSEIAVPASTPGAPPAGSLTIDALQHRLIRYIGIKIPDAKNILVDRIERIVGGASRDTYRFRLQYSQQNQAVERFLIIRLDPADSLIDTERRIEFFAYQAFFKTDVPVPEMLWLEEDTGHLGTQFFIAVELTGLQSNAAVMLSPEFAPSHARLAEQKWSILGKMTRHDPAGLGLDRIMQPVTPETAWLRELNYWEHVLDKDEVTPQPVIRWAIRWLRANPPPPAQKITVVHGDYRSGNFLFDMQGNIHGILDWEMAHLGDPLEDLGWGFNRVWCFAKDDRRGGLLPRDEAIRIWEAASGLKADPAALHWWELFNCVKGQGIWVSAAKAWIDGKNRAPILALASWMPMNMQDRHALELLGAL